MTTTIGQKRPKRPLINGFITTGKGNLSTIYFQLATDCIHDHCPETVADARRILEGIPCKGKCHFGHRPGPWTPTCRHRKQDYYQYRKLALISKYSKVNIYEKIDRLPRKSTAVCRSRFSSSLQHVHDTPPAVPW